MGRFWRCSSPTRGSRPWGPACGTSPERQSWSRETPGGDDGDIIFLPNQLPINVTMPRRGQKNAKCLSGYPTEPRLIQKVGGLQTLEDAVARHKGGSNGTSADQAYRER